MKQFALRIRCRFESGVGIRIWLYAARQRLRRDFGSRRRRKNPPPIRRHGTPTTGRVARLAVPSGESSRRRMLPTQIGQAQAGRRQRRHRFRRAPRFLNFENWPSPATSSPTFRRRSDVRRCCRSSSKTPIRSCSLERRDRRAQAARRRHANADRFLIPPGVELRVGKLPSPKNPVCRGASRPLHRNHTVTPI